MAGQWRIRAAASTKTQGGYTYSSPQVIAQRSCLLEDMDFLWKEHISQKERVSSEDMQLLWKEYFGDPWLINNPNLSADSQQKIAGEPCRLRSWYNPPAIQEELRRRVRSTELAYRVDGVRKEIQAMTEKGMYLRGKQGEAAEVMLVSSCKCKKHGEDTSLLAVLKACAEQKDVSTGSIIHADILKRGLFQKSIFLGNTIVNMYAKCGAFAKAQEVLDELLVRDVVSWNALITGYAHYGYGKEALDCFERMQHDGISPNAVTYACILKACGSIGAAEKGKEIHAVIVKEGLLGKSSVLGNALVDMYAKCGALTKAQAVFDQLPFQDVVSWTALIAGYAQHGHGEEALSCFGRMQHEGLSPDAQTFACILKACGSIGAAEKGKLIHAEIVKEGLLGRDSVLGNALVDMYAKCGEIVKAQEVFDELPVRDIVSSNALVDMYAKSGSLVKSQQVFDELLVRDVITWNALIAGYVQHGHGEKALNCFEQMQHEGLMPDAVTYACILRACGRIGAAEKGKEIHAEIVRGGLLGGNSVLGNALVDMYVKCGALTKAQQVFDKLPNRDVVTWTALIAGYTHYGHGKEALNCFECMQSEGLSPNAVTLACILKACGSIGAAEKGKEIHALIVRGEMLGEDSVLGNALVDMYVKCGLLGKAVEVFDELLVRDVISWNALIAGYAQHGQAEEALNSFGQMQHDGLSPNAVTFACILKACGSIGTAEKGQEIHDEIVRSGWLGKECVLGTALVDMYAKCGALAKAQDVFDELPVRDVATWNALMAGYAQLGKHGIVFESFNKMIGEGIDPNPVTFIVVLGACSYSGLVDEGEIYFDTMSTSYGIIPTVEHCTCMVNLFGHAGHFNKAMEVIKRMPSFDYLSLWCALLGACQKWGNVKLGRLAFEHAVRLDGKCAVAYVCMINIYAAAGMQEDVDEIEAMRGKNEAQKKLGCCCWTDFTGDIHSFCVGDKGHSQSKNLYANLEDIGQKISHEGYFPMLHWVSEDPPNYAKKDVACQHMEKLAALSITSKGASIPVVKSMEVCDGCRSVTSIVVRVEKLTMKKYILRLLNWDCQKHLVMNIEVCGGCHSDISRVSQIEKLMVMKYTLRLSDGFCWEKMVWEEIVSSAKHGWMSMQNIVQFLMRIRPIWLWSLLNAYGQGGS